MKCRHRLNPKCRKARWLTGCLTMVSVWFATAAAEVPPGRIVLEPEAGAMQVRARVPALDNQVFALGIPETIGCREALLVNFTETSIALALNPDWVHLERLTPGRAAQQVTLADTPRKDASTHDPTHPLYAIHGQDPREKAAGELGEKLVREIVTRLADQVTWALAQTVEPPSR
jgi:hypothetical protein